MSKRRSDMFLFDVYIAILKIREVVAKFDDVSELYISFTDWDSVIREFEIVGEATKHLLKNEKISQEYQIVVDFRNQITHGYFGIDQEAIWQIANSDIFDLESSIIKAISEIEESRKNQLIDSFVKDNAHLAFVVEKLKVL